jgi:hypothetical protein
MLGRIVLAAVVIASAFVGIVAGWQFGLAVLVLAALAFGVAYSLGFSADATTRWSSALYGNDREDANHWSQTGGKRKR